MADVRGAWNETGDKLTELGRKLKVHYDSQHGGESEQTREELADAARRLGSAVQDAFEAIGAAAKDKAVQDDVLKVGQSLAEALGATLGTAAEELRRAFSERKGAHPADDSPGTTEAEAGVAEPAPQVVVEVIDDAVVDAEESPAAGSPADSAEGSGKDAGKDADPKVEPWGTP